jgi:hypothetical protein
MMSREQAFAELTRDHHVGTFYILLHKSGLRKGVARYNPPRLPHLRVDVFQLPSGAGLDLVEETVSYTRGEPPPRESGHHWSIHREEGERVYWRRAAACLTKAEQQKLIRRYESLRVQAGLTPREQVGDPAIRDMQGKGPAAC